MHKTRLTRREAELLQRHGSTSTKRALGEALLRRADRGEIQFSKGGEK